MCTSRTPQARATPMLCASNRGKPDLCRKSLRGASGRLIKADNTTPDALISPSHAQLKLRCPTRQTSKQHAILTTVPSDLNRPSRVSQAPHSTSCRATMAAVPWYVYSTWRRLLSRRPASAAGTAAHAVSFMAAVAAHLSAPAMPLLRCAAAAGWPRLTAPFQSPLCCAAAAISTGGLTFL